MSAVPELLGQLDCFAGELDKALADAPHAEAYGELRRGEGPDEVLSLTAAELWEARLAEEPGDPVAHHHLAVIYHGLAIEGERRGEGGAAENWPKALRHWAELWRADAFWEDTKRRWAEAKGTTTREPTASTPASGTPSGDRCPTSS